MLTLKKALRATASSRIAFTGAGGKTTAIFRLARELLNESTTVFVTTSTHFALAQAASADLHLQIADGNDLHRIEGELPEGILVATSGKTEAGRLTGLPAEWMLLLKAIADRHQVPMLIEADGSRMLPLKAPARHEPVIPDFADTAVVTAGLSGLGSLLSSQIVHRPEKFSGISGLPLGKPIRAADLVSVLVHPEGGLKGIPEGARRVVLLNQADSREVQAAANRISGELLSVYDSVITAALSEADGVYSRRERVGAIILAAGGSRRMGRSKQLLDWLGKPLIAHAVEKALSAGCNPVLVVTGAEEERVASALAGYAVDLVQNPHWAEGQSTSVQAGLAHLPEGTGAAIFILVDQPFVDTSLIRAVMEVHASTGAPIVAPLIDEQRGNPVLFDRSTFPAFLDIKGDIGGRALFSKYPVTWVPWHNARALKDIDTEADFSEINLD